MEVPLTSKQQAQLSQLASNKGRNPETLAQEVLGLYLEHEARFIAAVKQGIASLDRGEYLEHSEVGARIEKLFKSS